MRRVIWTEPARDDLVRIERYIAAFKPNAAKRFATRLIAQADSLIEMPERGRKLRGEVRVLAAVQPYLIRYHVTDDAILILGVRHAARRRG